MFTSTVLAAAKRGEWVGAYHFSPFNNEGITVTLRALLDGRISVRANGAMRDMIMPHETPMFLANLYPSRGMPSSGDVLGVLDGVRRLRWRDRFGKEYVMAMRARNGR